MKKQSLISLIAQKCEWWKTVNEDFMQICDDQLTKLEKLLPHGSGIDCGCKIDREKSGSKKVVITFDFHHMNNAGYYDGWSSYRLTVTPVLWGDFYIKITGQNKNYIKDYLYDLFDSVLSEQIEL